jgi:hypothetical protein
MNQRRILGAWVAAVLALVVLIIGVNGAHARLAENATDALRAVSAPAATIVVTSTADSGSGTLRWALQQAGAGDTISFDPATFPLASPATIWLASALPDITANNLTVDASGAGVILEGSGAPGWTNGLSIVGASGATVKGLQILNFTGFGISIRGSATYNTVGGVNGSPGGACSGDCNLISANAGGGVQIQDSGTMSNVVSGNYIGTDLSGTAALGNGAVVGAGRWGIEISDEASHNRIGGTTGGERNLISGNGDLFCGPPELARASGGGILVRNSAASNRVQGNYLGTDVSGMLPIPNALVGVAIDNTSENLIGGAAAGEGNLISGNSCGGPPPPRAGIWLAGSSNKVLGNVIGPDVTGTGVFTTNCNGWTGIWVPAAGNLVAGNVLAGNCGSGIQMWSSNAIHNRVSQNSIYSNTQGIVLSSGANEGMFPPLFTAVTATGAEGIAVPGATVEVFSDDGDEGRWFQGTTTADGSGHFTLTLPGPLTGTNVTGTATDGDGNTSEFSSPYRPSRDVVLAAVYVPQSRQEVGELFTPTVRVGNGGSTPETFTVTAVITRAGVRVYEDEWVVADLGALHYRTITFTPWLPMFTDSYVFEALVSGLAPDDNPANDRLEMAVAVADDRVDLWSRDNPADDGREPAIGPVWQSPDLWVRNTADGLTTPQDPINNITNTVYVRIRNRGTLTATDAAITVYWHPPALVIGQPWWQLIDTVSLAQVAPGAVVTASLDWMPRVQGVLTTPYHTCLIDVISSTQEPAPALWDVRASNNIEQRNVDVISGTAPPLLRALAGGDAVTSTFKVGNPYAGEQLVDVIVDATDVPADVELQIDLGDLLHRWQDVGQGGLTGATVVSGTTKVSLAGGGGATISGVPMAGEELVEVVLEVHGLGRRGCQVDVSERIGGDVMGGVSLQVDSWVEAEVFLPLVLRGN